MHDVFGAEMMDVFDLDNGDIDLRILEPPKKKPETEEGSAAADQKQAFGKTPPSDGNVTAKNEGETAPLPTENFNTKNGSGQ